MIHPEPHSYVRSTKPSPHSTRSGYIFCASASNTLPSPASLFVLSYFSCLPCDLVRGHEQGIPVLWLVNPQRRTRTPFLALPNHLYLLTVLSASYSSFFTTIFPVFSFSCQSVRPYLVCERVYAVLCMHIMVSVFFLQNHLHFSFKVLFFKPDFCLFSNSLAESDKANEDQNTSKKGVSYYLVY